MSDLSNFNDKSTDNSSSEDELHVVTTSRSAFQTYRPSVTKRKHDDDDSSTEEEKRLRKDKRTSNDEIHRRRHGHTNETHIPSPCPWTREFVQQVDNEVEIIEHPESPKPSVSGVHDSSSSESDEEVFSINQVPRNYLAQRFLTAGTSVHIHVDAAFHPRPPMSDVHLDLWVRQHLELEQRRARQTMYNRNVSRPFNNFGALPPLNSILRRFLNFMPEYENDEGASPELIQNTTVLYNFEANHQINNNQNLCVVCIANFEVGQAVRQLPCLHIFHQHCVDRWLIDKKCCPICRNNIDDANQT